MIYSNAISRISTPVNLAVFLTEPIFILPVFKFRLDLYLGGTATYNHFSLSVS